MAAAIDGAGGAGRDRRAGLGVVAARRDGQPLDRVRQRREVERRHRLSPLRRRDLVGRVGGQREDAVLEAAVVLGRLGAQRVRHLLDVGDVGLDAAGGARELEGQQVGVGQPQHGAPADLGQRDAVGVVGIHEALEVRDRVVDRVVLAVGALAAEADVERGDAEVLQERAVVGARAERVDLEQPRLAQRGALLRRAAQDRAGDQAIADRAALGRLRDDLGDLVGEPFEAVRAADVEQAASVHVGVDVGHGLVGERLRRDPRPTRSSRGAPAPRRPRPRT